MIIDIVVMIIGFMALIKGGDFLVDGAAAIARRFGVSDLAVGLTIVAIGTSAPELVISIIGTIKGNHELLIGNIVGSNTANILLILGVSGLMRAISIQKSTVEKEIPFYIVVAILTMGLLNTNILDADFVGVSRREALVLLIVFLVFIRYTFTLNLEVSDALGSRYPFIGRSLLALTIGIAGLAVGGKMVVHSAIQMAARWGISEALIGVTIVAIGTSLPELFACIVAMLKNRPDIAIGNVVGSCIMNLAFVLGGSALIRPIVFDPSLNRDFLVSIVAGVLLALFMLTGKRHHLDRWEALIMLFAYGAYIMCLIFFL